MRFPALLESWRYRNPEAICDGLIAESKRKEKAESRKAEVSRLNKSRRIKLLTKLAKNGGLR